MGLSYWQLLLYTYLWVVGGMGWKFAYENGERTRLGTIATGFIVLLWPLLCLLAGIDNLKSQFTGAGKS